LNLLNSQDFDAIIYEPVQGLTGDLPDENYLRNLCNSVGAYLIADEMITGFGRCGPKFMTNHADYIACGKGIASGLPITFVVSREPLYTIPTGWTTTGAGNALCCEVAFITLQAIQKKKVERFEISTRKRFPKTKGAGAFLHIPITDGKEAKRRMESMRFVALYGPGSIRLAPCYTFPEILWESILETIKGELGDLLL
jgi:acetylornithine/succinyldiaminopimelate/putrescine aminotransferase